ncbi:MAG: hypothetical protein J6866_08455, partial [Victivallales bacterium]|nr:hypothetical protein [Victivallales bacterium]
CLHPLQQDCQGLKSLQASVFFSHWLPTTKKEDVEFQRMQVFPVSAFFCRANDDRQKTPSLE